MMNRTGIQRLAAGALVVGLLASAAPAGAAGVGLPRAGEWWAAAWNEAVSVLAGWFGLGTDAPPAPSSRSLRSGTAKADGSTNIDPDGRHTPSVQGQATTQSDGTAGIDPNGHP